MQKKIAVNKITTFSHSVLEHRERVNAVKPLAKAADVPYQDVLVPLQKDTRIPIRIYTPKKVLSPYPTLFYVPGTAFIAKEMAFTEVICTHIAERSKCRVIVINHRLAPEDQFPKGLKDAYYLLRFVLSAPDTLFHIDKTKIAIIGYSSGGNFAASMAIQAKKENLPIARQVLISPMVDLSRSLKDLKTRFEDNDTVITEAFVEWFLDLYLPEGINPQDPLVSPFWHKGNQFKGLPPTDILFAEYDRFRSDAEAYYDKLNQAGVDTYRLMVKDQDHSFLWHKLEIVEAIGERIAAAFGHQAIPRLLTSKNEHNLSFIKPRIVIPNRTSFEEKKEETITGIAAKL